jgi:hypothetical protein
VALARLRLRLLGREQDPTPEDLVGHPVGFVRNGDIEVGDVE